MSGDAITRLNTALEGRYRIERVELSRPIDRERESRAGVVGSGGLYLRRFAS